MGLRNCPAPDVPAADGSVENGRFIKESWVTSSDGIELEIIRVNCLSKEMPSLLLNIV